jgi:hypothetical protein
LQGTNALTYFAGASKPKKKALFITLTPGGNVIKLFFFDANN